MCLQPGAVLSPDVLAWVLEAAPKVKSEVIGDGASPNTTSLPFLCTHNTHPLSP